MRDSLRTTVSSTLPAALLATLFATLLTFLAAPAMTANPETMPTDFFLDPDYHGRWPEKPLWRPASDQVLATWEDDGEKAWWLFDPAGRQTPLAKPADLGADKVEEVKDLTWTPDGKGLLYRRAGDLWLFDTARRENRRVTSTEAEEQDPHFSPDGTRLGFVRDAELWILDLASGEERRLSFDGEPEVVFNATPDWVYWEEIWERHGEGFWWSPDGARIAYLHVDDREVGVYSLLDTRPLYPTVKSQRYPKAGEALPRIAVRVVDVASGETVTLPTHEDPDTYLARVHWHPSSHKVAIERLNREQTLLELLLCDLDGGCAVVARQEQPAWVNLASDFRFLADGRFLWSDENDGWRRLRLYAADGTPSATLTPEGWCLTSLDGFDADAGWLVFTAYSTGELGAAERHVFRTDLAGGPATPLDDTAGWHEALVADNGWWLHTHSTADSTPRLEIRHVDRTLARGLPAASPRYDRSQVPVTEIFTIPGPDGVRLPAQLVRPPGAEPTSKLPVLMYHYGGPASQVVENHWPVGERYAWHKWLAMHGYAVFSVDNQASRYFGKAGEDRLYRRFGELELAAQLAGVEYLKGLPWVDGGRLALWGWSGGGANTLYSVLHSPGTWKAAIAGAPVTDWRLYDAIWTERYLDRPADNPDGYKASSAITSASTLEDTLLVIHGTADDNVHPQNTFNFIDELMDAGAVFEVHVLPNETHATGRMSRPRRASFYGRMTDFLDRNLKSDVKE